MCNVTFLLFHQSLDSLRQMGVFGLSIPERLGGIAPDDRDDTQMMVVVTEALSEGSLGAAGTAKADQGLQAPRSGNA